MDYRYRDDTWKSRDFLQFVSSVQSHVQSRDSSKVHIGLVSATVLEHHVLTMSCCMYFVNEIVMMFLAALSLQSVGFLVYNIELCRQALVASF